MSSKLLRRQSLVNSVAMVFALGWAACPMAFALERSKQTAIDRSVRDYPVDNEQSLFGKIKELPVAINTVASNSATVERPEGTYWVENLQIVDGVVNATVAVYDNDGMLTGTYDVLSLTVTDENRIDYQVAVQSADDNWVETGSMVGISTSEHKALHLVSIDGQETNVNLLDYSGLAAEATTASDSCPVTTTPNPGGGGGVGSASVGVASACAILAATVVIVIVVIACYIFCWMLF